MHTNADPSTSVVHSFHEEKKPVPMMPVLTGGIILILAGIVTAYFLTKPSSSSVTKTVSNQEGTSGGQIFGVPDQKSFRDSAEGDLETGGLNGEGTHKLIRPGGDDQTVYLTSSVLDLNQFTGKKVRVWGETFAAKQAGWLMDVGSLEVL